jgi:hypothetical protein
MKHPKYKDIWTKSFGTEIIRLATTTETIFFVQKEDIPCNRKGDETYARIVCTFCDGKKINTEHASQWVETFLTTQATAEHPRRIF